MTLGHAISDSVSKEQWSTRDRIGKMAKNLEGVPIGFGRITVVRIFLVGIFLFIIASIVRLQIFQGKYFRGLAEGNRVSEIVVHASRGIIFDRNGVPLVANTPAFRLVSCNETGSVCSSNIVSKEQAIELEAKGLEKYQRLEIDATRHYLFGSSFGHLLGYVSEITEVELKEKRNYRLGDRIGRGGVEAYFETVLKGVDGKQLIEVDAIGKKERMVAEIEPKAGKNLVLAVDADLQNKASELMKGKMGAVIVSSVNTGEVLSLVSAPGFDPNIFTDLVLSSEVRTERINQLFTGVERPLYDRAISGTYPPGSTFKLVSATAGLESGAITGSTTIEDPGVLVIGPYKFPNWLWLKNGGTQGVLNVSGAIQKSNDIFFYRVGEWTGLERLNDWSKRFGLARRAGIELPGESTGVVPDEKWRKENNRSWYLGDTYHLAIGQGEMLVTPLQVNLWTVAIANGGKLCKPSVVKGELNQCQDLKINPKNIGLVKKGMEMACSEGGTAYPLFNFSVGDNGEKKIRVACKTGTAEFGDPKDRTHAWLTAYAPATNPEIAITVLVEAGGEGSDAAAPIVRDLLKEWFK